MFHQQHFVIYCPQRKSCVYWRTNYLKAFVHSQMKIISIILDHIDIRYESLYFARMPFINSANSRKAMIAGTDLSKALTNPHPQAPFSTLAATNDGTQTQSPNSVKLYVNFPLRIGRFSVLFRYYDDRLLKYICD